MNSFDILDSQYLMKPVIDFFSNYIHVTEQEMQSMLDIIHISSFKKNEELLRQGSIPRKVYFIVKGAIRIFYIDDKGKEFTTAFLFENQSILPVDSFTQQTPSPINAVTLEPSELIWTSHSEFFNFLEKYPNYEKALLQMYMEILPLQSQQLRLLNISSSNERYQKFCKLQPEALQRVPLKYIASYLGIALETLSRVRAGKL